MIDIREALSIVQGRLFLVFKSHLHPQRNRYLRAMQIVPNKFPCDLRDSKDIGAQALSGQTYGYRLARRG